VVKRMALLVAILWLVLYVSQRLVRAVFDLMHAPLTQSAWVVLLATAVPTLVAVWLIGRWNGLAGLRLSVTSVVAVLATFAVWAIAGYVLSALRLMTTLGNHGDASNALIYLLYAIAVVATSWLIAGLSEDSWRRGRSAN
jgi:hypothetical protein